MVEIADQLVMVATRDIKPYHRNPRNNDATVDKLVELIPKVGFNVPLVLDRQNVIVKGHSRWRAAVRLKMPALPCLYTDADPETIKLDRLADNRVQEFSTWDKELLGGELASLNLDFAFDLGTLDFVLADNRRRGHRSIDRRAARRSDVSNGDWRRGQASRARRASGRTAATAASRTSATRT